MVLGESQAVQVLNTYLNFCKVFQQEGTITDENFNRIRFINACINGQQDKIKEVWGDLFDEVYCLLQKPEIKLRLEKEQMEIQLIREKRSLDKRKSLSNLESKTGSQNSKSSKNSSASSKQVKTVNKTGVQQSLLGSSNSRGTKQKRAKQKQSKRKNQEDKIPEKSIEEIREIFWRSIAREKQKDEARKKLRDQNVQPIREVPPMYPFDDSSSFDDIMDERRAEGKGYGGSK
jgi:hypothetical protein